MESNDRNKEKLELLKESINVALKHPKEVINVFNTISNSKEKDPLNIILDNENNITKEVANIIVEENKFTKKGVDLFVKNENLKETLNKAVDDKNIIKNGTDAAINQKDTIKKVYKTIKNFNNQEDKKDKIFGNERDILDVFIDNENNITSEAIHSAFQEPKFVNNAMDVYCDNPVLNKVVEKTLEYGTITEPIIKKIVASPTVQCTAKLARQIATDENMESIKKQLELHPIVRDIKKMAPAFEDIDYDANIKDLKKNLEVYPLYREIKNIGKEFEDNGCAIY